MESSQSYIIYITHKSFRFQIINHMLELWGEIIGRKQWKMLSFSCKDNSLRIFSHRTIQQFYPLKIHVKWLYITFVQNSFLYQLSHHQLYNKEKSSKYSPQNKKMQRNHYIARTFPMFKKEKENLDSKKILLFILVKTINASYQIRKLSVQKTYKAWGLSTLFETLSTWISLHTHGDWDPSRTLNIQWSRQNIQWGMGGSYMDYRR